MPKIQTIDPNEVRKPGYVEFKPIHVNQYQKKVIDEKDNFTNDEFKSIYHDMALIREFEQVITTRDLHIYLLVRSQLLWEWHGHCL